MPSFSSRSRPRTSSSTSSGTSDAAPSNVLYFSTSIHTGVGAGDIVPITGEGKAVVTLHMLLSFIATLLVLQRI